MPEYEQTKLRFGSFTSGLDSEQVPASAPQDTEQPEQLGEPFPILLIYQREDNLVASSVVVASCSMGSYLLLDTLN